MAVTLCFPKIVLVLSVFLVVVARKADEVRLVYELLKNAATEVRPVSTPTNNVTVQFGITLVSFDLDEKKQVLTVKTWNKFKWRNEFMQWDPKVFSGISSIRLPIQKIWTPDITLYNNADEELSVYRNGMAIVFSDGNINWIPQTTHKSICKLDVVDYPFDTHTCILKFGSWTYSDNELSIDLWGKVKGFDMVAIKESIEWEIVEQSATKKVDRYLCCTETYGSISFSLTVKRRASLYYYILILPSVLLSALTLVLFLVSPQSPTKMQLGMFLFVVCTVMLLNLKEWLPSVPTSIPKIGFLLCFNIIIVTIAIFLNAIVVNIANTSRPVPMFIKKMFRKVSGLVLCVMIPKSQPPSVDKKIDDTAEMASDSATQTFLAKWEEQVRCDLIRREWESVATIVDRLFFVVYLITIIVALSVVLSSYA